MSRCSRTSKILDALLAGAELAPRDGAHIAACGECATGLAHRRRFEAELSLVTTALVASQNQGGDGLAAAREPRSRLTWTRRIVVGGLATAAVIAGLVGVATLGGSMLDVGGQRTGLALWDGRVPGTGAQDEARQQAFERAQREEVARANRMVEEFLSVAAVLVLEDAEWRPIQADVCGEVVAVTVEQSGPEPGLVWMTGSVGEQPITSGMAGAVEAAELAAARAATAERCVRAIESTPYEELAAAIERDAGIPARPDRIGVELISPQLAAGVVEGTPLFGQYQRWIGVLTRGANGWDTDPSHWIGANIPANEGLMAYKLDNLGLEVDERLIVGALPTEAAQVQITVDGTAYRYPVDGAGNIFVVVSPHVGAETEFRVLDDAGRILSEGSVG